jgi:hypothetical protein
MESIVKTPFPCQGRRPGEMKRYISTGAAASYLGVTVFRLSAHC